MALVGFLLVSADRGSMGPTSLPMATLRRADGGRFLWWSQSELPLLIVLLPISFDGSLLSIVCGSASLRRAEMSSPALSELTERRRAVETSMKELLLAVGPTPMTAPRSLWGPLDHSPPALLALPAAVPPSYPLAVASVATPCHHPRHACRMPDPAAAVAPNDPQAS